MAGWKGNVQSQASLFTKYVVNLAFSIVHSCGKLLSVSALNHTQLETSFTHEIMGSCKEQHYPICDNARQFVAMGARNRAIHPALKFEQKTLIYSKIQSRHAQVGTLETYIRKETCSNIDDVATSHVVLAVFFSHSRKMSGW